MFEHEGLVTVEPAYQKFTSGTMDPNTRSHTNGAYNRRQQTITDEPNDAYDVGIIVVNHLCPSPASVGCARSNGGIQILTKGRMGGWPKQPTHHDTLEVV